MIMHSMSNIQLVPPLLYSFSKHFLSVWNAQGSVLGAEKAGVTHVLWKPRT